MNKKIQLKNILFGILIGLIVFLIISSIWFYLYILKPLKESEEMKIEMDVFEQQMEEYMEIQKNQQDH